MPPLARKKPANSLDIVKQRIRENDILFDSSSGLKDPLQTAFWEFGWDEECVKKALLKLNDRYHNDNPDKNHFHKHEPHRDYPAEQTHVDYYKAYKLMESEDVYTHLHIRENTTRVIVDSFHQLD
jgi:hypothetical protein